MGKKQTVCRQRAAGGVNKSPAGNDDHLLLCGCHADGGKCIQKVEIGHGMHCAVVSTQFARARTSSVTDEQTTTGISSLTSPVSRGRNAARPSSDENHTMVGRRAEILAQWEAPTRCGRQARCVAHTAQSGTQALYHCQHIEW